MLNTVRLARVALSSALVSALAGPVLAQTAAAPDRTVLPMPFPPFQGVIGETYAESTADWPTLPAPPEGAPIERWLRSFPSFGFLLAVKPHQVDAVTARFAARDLAATAIGRVEQGSAVSLCQGEERALFWDWRAEPYLRPTEPADA